MVEAYSFPEGCSECSDNPENQSFVNKYNLLYDEFKKFNNHEYKDKNGNIIKLSCSDGGISKWGAMRTISVDINEKNGVSNSGNGLEMIDDNNCFLAPFRNFMANYTIQKERQKYTREGERKKVNRVKYSLNIHERTNVDGTRFVSFYGGKHYLDAINHPHEIYSIKSEELEEILNYYDKILMEAKGHDIYAFKTNIQKKVEKDQKEADCLLKNNGLVG